MDGTAGSSGREKHKFCNNLNYNNMHKTYRLSINMWALDTDKAHILHRIGSQDYTKIHHATVKDPDAWEEIAVENIPPYTKAEYDAKVAELVRERYTADEEFAIQRKMIGAMTTPSPLSEAADADSAPADSAAILDEFQAYNAYVEQCKARAKDAGLYAAEERGEARVES